MNKCLFRTGSVLIWINSWGWSVFLRITLHVSYVMEWESISRERTASSGSILTLRMSILHVGVVRKLRLIFQFFAKISNVIFTELLWKTFATVFKFSISSKGFNFNTLTKKQTLCQFACKNSAQFSVFLYYYEVEEIFLQFPIHSSSGGCF